MGSSLRAALQALADSAEAGSAEAAAISAEPGTAEPGTAHAGSAEAAAISAEPGTAEPGTAETTTEAGSGSDAGVGTATGRDVGAVVVALADQPLVGAEAVARLIAAYHDGATVAVAVYDGRARNPVLLARECWAEVIAMATGDQGARPFLRARPDLVTVVECGDTGRPDDIDTPADLARITAAATERA
jgi:nicotine blue oxidoreductase